MGSSDNRSTRQDEPNISKASQSINPFELPSALLRAAYLVGKIPVKALRSDPRVSYAVYVLEQYCAVHDALQNSELEFSNRLPLVVNVHSTRRDAITCRDSLIDFADKHGVAVLAPLFPAGLDSPFDLDSYKNLRSETLQSDLRLLDMLNEVGHIWPGTSTDPIILCGFSGGAQFVHRFTYLNPERISAVAIAAPGQVTKLNSEPWPKGIGNASAVFPGEEIDIAAIAKIEDTLLLVGEDDVFSEGQVDLLQWMAARKAKLEGETVHEKLGRTSRVQSIKSLQHNWQKNGIEAELEIVPGVGHSYQDLLPSLIAWLRECSAVVDRE
ncbi:putative alpha/Beta hydrolase [Septoria linicola]|nr:putative alpha/Beta hydrolase [Septoria linicola]